MKNRANISDFRVVFFHRSMAMACFPRFGFQDHRDIDISVSDDSDIFNFRCIFLFTTKSCLSICNIHNRLTNLTGGLFDNKTKKYKITISKFFHRNAKHGMSPFVNMEQVVRERIATNRSNMECI